MVYRLCNERRGLKLEFIRTNGLVVWFKVLPENGDEATEVFGPTYQEQPLEMVA